MSDAPTSGSGLPASRNALIDRLFRDPYTLSGYLLFLVTALTQWRIYVRKHEAIYLLGSRRVADPEFLSGDLSWSTLPPTTFLFDHLMEPLSALLGEFGIMTLGRIVTWALLAWSLALLARTLRLPAWSMVVGFAVFLLSRQSILACGSFVEGFQPKSFAYPLVFFALSFAIRGQVVRAGAAAGLAAVFHIIIGGWGCLALFLSMLFNRGRFGNRELAMFLLATVPFVAPLVLSVGLFHVGGLSGQEGALMDEIYVTFAQPHCCDPTFFMSSSRWIRVLLVFPFAVGLVFLWPKERGSRVVGYFVLMLILFFFLGIVARPFEVFSLLKVYPFQWAAGAPALFLFVLLLAFASAGLPKPAVGKLIWALGLVVAGWLVVDREAFTSRLANVPKKLLASVEGGREGTVRGRGLYFATVGLRLDTREHEPGKRLRHPVSTRILDLRRARTGGRFSASSSRSTTDRMEKPSRGVERLEALSPAGLRHHR